MVYKSGSNTEGVEGVGMWALEWFKEKCESVTKEENLKLPFCV